MRTLPVVFLLAFAANTLRAQVVPDSFEVEFNTTSACTQEAISGTLSCSAVGGLAGQRDVFQQQCEGTAVGASSGNVYVISETVVFGSRLDFLTCHGTEYFDFQVRLISRGPSPNEVFRFRERARLQPENELLCLLTRELLDFQSECRGAN